VIFSNPAECVLCWLAVCSPVCYQIAVVKFSSTTFYLNYRYDVKKALLPYSLHWLLFPCSGRSLLVACCLVTIQSQLRTLKIQYR